MVKRDLIEMLEKTDLPDDAEVNVSFCYNTSGDTDDGFINDVLAEGEEVILDCCTTNKNCDY